MTARMSSTTASPSSLRRAVVRPRAPARWAAEDAALLCSRSLLSSALPNASSCACVGSLPALPRQCEQVSRDARESADGADESGEGELALTLDLVARGQRVGGAVGRVADVRREEGLAVRVRHGERFEHWRVRGLRKTRISNLARR